MPLNHRVKAGNVFFAVISLSTIAIARVPFAENCRLGDRFLVPRRLILDFGLRVFLSDVALWDEHS
jgi:hypothetical protein